jgi:hypothetical protein
MRISTSIPFALAVSLAAAAASAEEIGQIKSAKGNVSVERAGQSLVGSVGLRLETADLIKTGVDGAAGITMADNSLLSIGPNSILALSRFEYEPATSQGRLDAQLQRGTLAVVSGRLAKQSPQAMTVRTPSASLAVRGTEFVVAAQGD